MYMYRPSVLLLQEIREFLLNIIHFLQTKYKVIGPHQQQWSSGLVGSYEVQIIDNPQSITHARTLTFILNMTYCHILQKDKLFPWKFSAPKKIFFSGSLSVNAELKIEPDATDFVDSCYNNLPPRTDLAVVWQYVASLLYKQSDRNNWMATIYSADHHLYMSG